MIMYHNVDFHYIMSIYEFMDYYILIILFRGSLVRGCINRLDGRKVCCCYCWYRLSYGVGGVKIGLEVDNFVNSCFSYCYNYFNLSYFSKYIHFHRYNFQHFSIILHKLKYSPKQKSSQHA